MASSPITSWKIDGEKVETETDFIFLDSKITVDCDCSHKIKRCLLLGRKAMTNLGSIVKSRDITLPIKFCIVEDMVFPVVMYRGESWTIKKAEHWRIDAFELWCWRRLLRVPWTARRARKSILKKKISPEYSLEGLMLKMELRYILAMDVNGRLMENTLMLGKVEGRRRRGQQRVRWLDGTTDSMDMSLSRLWSSWWTGKPVLLLSMGSQIVGHDWTTELNWTEQPVTEEIKRQKIYCCKIKLWEQDF